MRKHWTALAVVDRFARPHTCRFSPGACRGQSQLPLGDRPGDAERARRQLRSPQLRQLLRSCSTSTATKSSSTATRASPTRACSRDGTVQVNERSPAYYLNDTRYPTERGAADREPQGAAEMEDGRQLRHLRLARPPDALRLARDSAAGHRHRAAKRRSSTTKIPLRIDGRKGAIDGTLYWVGSPNTSKLPFIIGGIACPGAAAAPWCSSCVGGEGDGGTKPRDEPVEGGLVVRRRAPVALAATLAAGPPDPRERARPRAARGHRPRARRGRQARAARGHLPLRRAGRGQLRRRARLRRQRLAGRRRRRLPSRAAKARASAST